MAPPIRDVLENMHKKTLNSFSKGVETAIQECYGWQFLQLNEYSLTLHNSYLLYKNLKSFKNEKSMVT